MSESGSNVKLVLVAAHAENGVIGRDGDMPWRLPSDLKHFKAVTLGTPVIMGRKTYLSIGRPLPGRANIVVSRSGFTAEGVETVDSLDKALERARSYAQESGASQISVIGGGQIYALAIDRADELILTEPVEKDQPVRTGQDGKRQPFRPFCRLAAPRPIIRHE